MKSLAKIQHFNTLYNKHSESRFSQAKATNTAMDPF